MLGPHRRPRCKIPHPLHGSKEISATQLLKMTIKSVLPCQALCLSLILIAMVSQDDLEKQEALAIYEDVDQGGHVKTLNVPADRIQRKTITNRGEASSFRVKLKLFTCVHGQMNQISRTPATLILLDAQFVVVGTNKGRFRSAGIRLQFRNQDDRSGQCPPSIVAFAPFRVQKRMNETSEDRNHQFNIGATGGFQAAAQAQLNASWQRTATYQRNYFDRGSAGTGDNEQFDVDDSVWWDLQESLNPHQKDGIRPNCLFAVLVQRTTDADFLGDIRVNVDAGTWQSVREEWKFKTGQTVPDDPVIFHPGFPPQGTHEGIDPENLGAWAVGDRLAKLTEIPGLEPLAPPEAVKN